MLLGGFRLFYDHRVPGAIGSARAIADSETQVVTSQYRIPPQRSESINRYYV